MKADSMLHPSIYYLLSPSLGSRPLCALIANDQVELSSAAAASTVATCTANADGERNKRKEEEMD